MKFQIAYFTDTGIEKQDNQDSFAVFEAETARGNLLMAILCDGMGGLEKGEVASATLVRVFEQWFRETFPGMLFFDNPLLEIRYSWERLIKTQNQNIAEYGRKCRIQLGSTLTAILFMENGEYLIGHVGDSRVYLIRENELEILTKDQTVVANEVRQGKLTPTQAAADPRRNVLLQCIGASKVVNPDFVTGQAVRGECYMLCSDGFRHEVSEAEIREALSPESSRDENIMREHIKDLVRKSMERGERDNISAVLLKLE